VYVSALFSFTERCKKFSVVFEALVFDTDSMGNETVPRYVSYKVRMDIDRVDSTTKFKVTRRYVHHAACVSSLSFVFLFLLYM